MILSTASGQTAQHKPLPREQLERYEDPPVFVGRLGASPAMVSQHGAYTSYQVNVDSNGQNITGDAANEPSITVDPTNHNRMAIGWRQFYTVTSNFRQAGWAYTTNGGTSWTFPGVLENNVFRSDPVLFSDNAGSFFYLSLMADSFFDDMWRSLNGGQSWTKLAVATGGDKQWFTIDNTNSTGHGFQYQYWSTASDNYGTRQFSRSTDGGFNWMNPINIPNFPIWGTLDVDTNGNLFLGGVNQDDSSLFLCERSTDAKNAAVTPSFDQITSVNFGGDLPFSVSINPVGLAGQVFLVVDRSGTSTNNNIYMLATVQPNGASNGTDLMFVRSTDGGKTFGAPHRINDDPINHNKWHWLGALSAAPNGRLDVVWLDTRNAANNTDSQLFYSYSMDGGITWSANVDVSASFNPFLGYPNQNKMGDYITIVSDNAGGDVAYCATFNGEEDIYYVRVAPPPQLRNISSRVDVLTGDQVAIAGFIVTGTDPKKVIIRGIGPSLSNSGVQGALQDPTLELHDGSGALITANDNWKTKSDGSSQQADVEATGLQPTSDLESAIVMTLNPGAYTAILAGKNGGTGVGLIEVYDLAQTARSNLTNISTRGFVGTGDNVMIGGLIVGGGTAGGTGHVIVRALGPSLSSSGIQNALQDPTLELHDANGLTIASNDNWKTRPDGTSQQAEIEATNLPPSNDLESALVQMLPAGNYTAIVGGRNNTTGVGLVEVYNLQ